MCIIEFIIYKYGSQVSVLIFLYLNDIICVGRWRYLALLTVEQAAEYLQLSPLVVRRWLREGKIRGAKIGRIWRIDEKDLVAFVESAKTKSTKR